MFPCLAEFFCSENELLASLILSKGVGFETPNVEVSRRMVLWRMLKKEEVFYELEVFVHLLMKLLIDPLSEFSVTVSDSRVGAVEGVH